MTTSRVTAGVPTGGQFAATTHAEPQLALVDATPADQSWAAAGFGPGDDGDWAEVTPYAVEAAAWRDAGFDQFDAAWMNQEFGADATVWRDKGFDAKTTADFAENDITDLQKAAAYRDAFTHLDPGDRAYLGSIAADWDMQVGDATVAGGFSRAGFSPAEASDWHINRFAPEDAKPWHDAHFTPDQAQDWDDHGLDPQQATKWRRRGFDARTALRQENAERPPVVNPRRVEPDKPTYAPDSEEARQAAWQAYRALHPDVLAVYGEHQGRWPHARDLVPRHSADENLQGSEA